MDWRKAKLDPGIEELVRVLNEECGVETNESCIDTYSICNKHKEFGTKMGLYYLAAADVSGHLTVSYTHLTLPTN